MKRCPICERTYSDETITFCLADGSLLSAPYPTKQKIDSGRGDPPATLVLPETELPGTSRGPYPRISSPQAQTTQTVDNEEVDPTKLRRRQIQIALTSFLALFAVVGIALYGLPFYYDYMVREFGMTRTQVTSGNALSKLVVGPLFGYFAGWIVDRFGPRRLMLAGVLMAGVALIGLAQMTAFWMFYFFYLLNALGYVCAGPLPNQVLLARWFDRSRGKAMGFAYLGIGIGGFLVFQISAVLVKNFGWHVALTTLGILIIAIAFPLTYFVKESPTALTTKQTKAPIVPIGWAFTSKRFYLLAIGSMCSIGAVGGANQHLKLFLTLDRGFGDQAAANVASLILISSLFGRLLMGWLADQVPKKYVMLLIYMLVAAGISLLFFVGPPSVLYAFAVVFGIGLGGDYMIIPLMAAELFGVKVLGRLMGVILTADGVAEAVSPLLVGVFRDTSGSYLFGFVFLVTLALAGAIAVTFLPKRMTDVQSLHVR